MQEPPDTTAPEEDRSPTTPRFYTSDIPKARAQCLKLAAHLRAKQLDDEANRLTEIVTRLMHRAKPKRISKSTSRPMTDYTRERINVLLNTEMSHQEIADLVGVNPGRVSEIAHKRIRTGKPKRPKTPA